MKKYLLLFALFLSLSGLLLVRQADAGYMSIENSLIEDIDSYGGGQNDTTDQNPSYWTGSDENPSLHQQLENSSWTTEAVWLKALLGKEAIDPFLSYMSTSENFGETNSLDAYDPGFLWDYAVVKYGGHWAAYSANFLDIDPKLTIENLNKNISHVSWFKSSVAHTPEPATMLLFGFGLIGLAGFSRKLKKS